MWLYYTWYLFMIYCHTRYQMCKIPTTSLWLMNSLDEEPGQEISGWLASALWSLGPQLGKLKWLGITEMSGVWKQLQASFFIHLGWVLGSSEPSWDCCLPVAFPHGLGFLITWWPQGSQTSYMVPRGSTNKQGRSCVPFCDLAVEVA